MQFLGNDVEFLAPPLVLELLESYMQLDFLRAWLKLYDFMVSLMGRSKVIKGQGFSKEGLLESFFTKHCLKYCSKYQIWKHLDFMDLGVQYLLAVTQKSLLFVFLLNSSSI